MQSIISVLESKVFLAMAASVVGAVTAELLKLFNIDVAKPFRKVNKAIRTPLNISIITMVIFVLKYGVPALSIVFLMSTDNSVDKWFVFAICFCFAVLIISVVRDALINFTLKTLDAIINSSDKHKT